MLQIAQSFVLEKTSEGYQLKRSHAYYFQVQCQLICTGRMFVVWTCEDVHIERVYPNEEL